MEFPCRPGLTKNRTNVPAGRTLDLARAAAKAQALGRHGAQHAAMHVFPLPNQFQGMVARLFIALIRVYQLTLSRLIRLTIGNVCRFEPSCSRYAAQCLADHGALRGSLLSIKRLCRCHPFHPGGYDPPPPPRAPNRARTPSIQQPEPVDPNAAICEPHTDARSALNAHVEARNAHS